jgi:hypothetical protein
MVCCYLLPSITYGIEVLRFSTKNAKKVHTALTRPLKRALCLNPRTKSTKVLAEFGILPADLLRVQRLLLYLLRLACIPDRIKHPVRDLFLDYHLNTNFGNSPFPLGKTLTQEVVSPLSKLRTELSRSDLPRNPTVRQFLTNTTAQNVTEYCRSEALSLKDDPSTPLQQYLRIYPSALPHP